MEIVKYTDESEVEEIIQEQNLKGNVLVHVSNVTEGNFLGFMLNSEITEQGTQADGSFIDDPSSVAQTPQLISEIQQLREEVEFLKEVIDELIMGGA